MASYMFTSDGNNLLCNGILITDTNIDLFTQNEFQERFFADIMKDSQTDTAVSNIKDWLTNCYSGNGNIPKGTYEKSLENLEDKVYSQKFVTDNITVLKNILKTSTVGSNTKISLADNVFWESGFGSKDIIALSDYNTFLTPASKLDPLSKEKAKYYWPEVDHCIIGFHESFTGRLGFPHTVWVVPSPDKVQIIYSNREVIEYDVTKDRDPVGKYLAGNNTKNAAINALTKDTGCHDFIKYVETKELGDVAQVWNYLAFVAINAINTGNNFKKMREKSVMITTDSVVLLFCILLHLSCVYTGSREGVESGRCTLKHYLAGDVNYNLKLKTMIDNHYNRIKSQLAATKFGLLIMKRDKGKFWYYRYNRGKIAKTLGSYSLSQGDAAKISRIDELFQAEIDNIDDSLRRAEGEYDAANKNAADDGEVDSKFRHFCVAINRFKYSQLLTRLNTRSYVLHPSQLLNDYAKIIDPTITDIPNLNQVIIQALNDNINIEQGGGRDLVSIGGGYDGNGDLSQDAEIYYYDFLLLTCIEINFFRGDALKNQQVQELFPVYYDHIVSKIDENTDLFSFFGDTKLRDFLNMYTDHYIINRGRELSTLINFAEDVDVEISDLETYLQLAQMTAAADEYDVARGVFLEHETGDNTGDNTEDNTGMVVERAQGDFDETSFLSQQPTGTTLGLLVTPQRNTSKKTGMDEEEETSVEETGGRKPGRHKSKKNKHKISIKNKSKKNIKKKRTIKNKRTIKKKITKRHKKTRKQN